MKKILLVDDENELREAIVEIIPWNYYGYEIVFAAENGQQALEYFLHHPIDIVLTDLVMPKMDGLQLIEQLKKHTPALPIIILSNYSDFSYVKQALLLGADDYLLKASISEFQIIKLLNHIFSNTHELPKELTQEMQLRLLLSDFSINTTEYKQFFANFSAPKQILLATTKKNYETIGKEPFLQIIHELVPETNLVLTEYQQWAILLLDTDIDETILQLQFQESPLAENDLFFVAKKVTGQDNLKKVLVEELVPKMNYQFLFATEKLIWSSYEFQSDHLPPFDKERFRQFFKENQISLAFQYLMDYAHSLRSLKISEETLKDFTSTSFFLLFNELEKTNHFTNELNLIKLNLLKKITDSKNFHELLTNYEDGLTDLQKMLSLNADPETLLFKKISHYIYENSNHDISLKKVADHFHYNYSYLSSLFNKQKEMSFTEYVTNIRIQKSKELLRAGELNISEIADSVGYSDLSYFSKVFKKVTGKTPSEYMRGRNE